MGEWCQYEEVNHASYFFILLSVIVKVIFFVVEFSFYYPVLATEEELGDF